jgi:hypothetical protein
MRWCFVLALGMACTPRRERPQPIVIPPAMALAGATPDASTAPPPKAGRWLPGLDFADIEGGRLGAVVNGRRVVWSADKATVIDVEPLPGGASSMSAPPSVAVPAALGGGWLFLRDNGLYFARSFEGEVRLVVSGPIELAFGIGYGAVLVEVGNQRRLVELETGRTLPLPVPGLVELFSLPSGEVAARTQSGALYLARGRDRPFTKIATPHPVVRLASVEKEFAISYDQDDQARLTREGRLHPPPPESGDIPNTLNVWAIDPRTEIERYDERMDARTGERMLDENTVAMSPAVVLGIREDDLVAFDVGTGRVSGTQAGAFGAYDRCYLVRGGRPSFAACEGKKTLELLRLDDPSSPPIFERSFEKIFHHGELGVASSGAPVLTRRRCNGADEHGAFCMRNADGTWKDVAPPPDPTKLLDRVVFIEKVAADVDGTPYGYARERVTDDLVVVDGRAREVKVIPRRDLPAWDYRAFWSSSFTVMNGEVHLLFPGDHPGVLVLRRDGRIDARTFEGEMAVAGRHALLVTKAGALRESLDAGETFHDVAEPPGGADPRTLSCSEGGCHVGPWLRLGW